MKHLILLFGFIALSSGLQAQTAEVQLMHNAPDTSLNKVDIWIDSTKALPDFEFQTATPFVSLPAGIPVEIRIQPAGSQDTTNPLFFTEQTLASGESYIAVANGFVSATGYTDTPALNLHIFPAARASANQPGNTDVLIYHGSPDVPPVNIEETGTGTLVNNISYSEFDSGYLELTPDDYTLQVQDTAGAVTVREYSAPLQSSGWADSAVTVLASGFINPRGNSNGAPFGLFAVLPGGGNFIELPATTADIQIAHNSPDKAVDQVNILVTGSLGEVLDKRENVMFRTGTPVSSFPASSDTSLELTVHVLPDTSGSLTSALYTQTIKPAGDSSYLAVTSGIISSTGYNPSRPFNIDLHQGLLTQARTTGTTDVLVYHGATDAPEVDIYEEGSDTTWINNLPFNEFQGYIEVVPDDFSVSVQDTSGTVDFRKYDVPLQSLGLEDSTLIVLASGFLNPAENSNGSPFGMYALLPDGGPFLELPLQTGEVQIIHNSADLGVEAIELFVEGPAGERIARVPDFPFRSATPFIELPSDIDLNIHVAPEGSDSISQSIFDTPANLTQNGSYTAVANGIISQSGYEPGAGSNADFDIHLRSDARTASNNAGETDLLIFHGVTDAPPVTVVEVGLGAGVLSGPLDYGAFDGYIELLTNNYELQVLAEDGTPIAKFDAPLSDLALQDEAVTILASGFVDPDKNSNGPEFGLWAALTSGGPLIELDPISTSVEEHNGESAISLYPNPAIDEVNIHVPQFEKAQLEIFSVSGSLIKSKNITSENTRIGLTDFKAGTYIYRVKTNNTIKNGKLNVTR